MVCPHAAIRMKVFPADGRRGRSGRLPVARSSSPARSLDHRLTIQVAPDDCTGCGVCVDVCPAKSKTEIKHKSINLEPAEAHRDVERPRWDFFQSIPPARSQPDRPRHRQGRPGPGAPVRVLAGLQRLRRDALPQARLPALRRPHDRGQRHGLLVDLRRQPAHDPVDRQRPGPRSRLEQLALRGQRRVRPGHAPRARRAERSGAPPSCEARPGDRDGARQRASSRPTRRPSPRSTPSASESRSCARSSARWGRNSSPTPATSSPLPTTSSGRASGSSAATAGPTTSATAAWTTSSAPGGTSTSSSSTPRSTRTPAARPRRPRRAARWPSSPRPGSPGARRTSAPSPAPTATSTSPRCRWAPTTPRRQRRSSRPMPGQDRRSSSRTAPASPTASTCRSPCPTRRTPSRAATGRSTGSIRATPKGASPSSSTRPSRRSRSASSSPGETRFAVLARTQPERAAELAELAQADVDERWRYYEQLAAMHRSVPHVHHDPDAQPEAADGPRPRTDDQGDEA